MNVYDHEDAFADANRCAGRRTKLADALKSCTSKDMAVKMINDLQVIYLDLFEAFIEGVEYGRRNPKEVGKPDEIPF